MDMDNGLLVIGVVMLALTAGLLAFTVNGTVAEQDQRFNTEASSFANGDAEFVYTPVSNQSIDTLVSYNITVNNQTVDSINNRQVNNLSRDQPFNVTVQAEATDRIRVDMEITDLKGTMLHQSDHAISGEK